MLDERSHFFHPVFKWLFPTNSRFTFTRITCIISLNICTSKTKNPVRCNIADFPLKDALRCNFGETKLNAWNQPKNLQPTASFKSKRLNFFKKNFRATFQEFLEVHFKNLKNLTMKELTGTHLTPQLQVRPDQTRQTMALNNEQEFHQIQVVNRVFFAIK